MKSATHNDVAFWSSLILANVTTGWVAWFYIALCLLMLYLFFKE